jgi:hypothetical protein
VVVLIRAPLSPIAFTGQYAHIAGMTERATHRPPGFAKPAHWDDSPPPQPLLQDPSAEQDEDPDGLSPTRYGDWVLKGIAVDF